MFSPCSRNAGSFIRCRTPASVGLRFCITAPRWTATRAILAMADSFVRRNVPARSGTRWGLFGARAVRSKSVLAGKGSSEPKVLGDQFALLVSCVVDYAIFMLDPTGVVVTWNEGAQRIKGYRADEIIGRHFSAFYPA